MSSQPTRKERELAWRRSEILDAAEEVFGRRGYGGAKMAEIAVRAEFGVGYLYKVFDDKSALYEAVIERRFGELHGTLDELIAGEGSPKEKIRGICEAIIDHFVDYEVAVTRRYLEAAGGKLDIAYFGNDFGTQRGLFVSPEMWQRFFRKPLKRFFDAAHDFGCKVMKHSCGSVRDIIPSLIEDGLNVLDPIQVRAAGMDMPGLVRDFGGKLAFHGAVDTQQTLPFGTTDDVRAQVRGYRDLTREQGGYVLCGSQEFIEDIPLDNILAIYDENMK